MRTQIAVALLLLTATVVEGEEAHLLADLNQDFASAIGSTRSSSIPPGTN